MNKSHLNIQEQHHGTAYLYEKKISQALKGAWKRRGIKAGLDEDERSQRSTLHTSDKDAVVVLRSEGMRWPVTERTPSSARVHRDTDMLQ